MSDGADAALERANAALDSGRYAAAAEAFDEAAAHELAAGRRTEAGHATRFAATSWRLGGQPGAAAQRAAAAAALAERGSPPHIAALLEQSDALLAADAGAGAHAAAVLTRALEDGRAAAMPAAAEAVVRRRRAMVLAASGDTTGAARDLRAASALHSGLGDTESALRDRVDEISYLRAGGDAAQSARLAGATRRAAESAGDHRVLCDLDLLAAARALDRGAGERGLKLAGDARQHALAATDPIRYLGAALAVAELAEATGDLSSAYESLAVGLVTLAELLGRNTARQCFEPQLVAQRARWGADRFAAVKADYEERRRHALDGA